MIQRQAAVVEKLADDGEIRAQVFQPHVLEHADGGDLVETLVDLAVILDADIDLARQTGAIEPER